MAEERLRNYLFPDAIKTDRKARKKLLMDLISDVEWTVWTLIQHIFDQFWNQAISSSLW